ERLEHRHLPGGQPHGRRDLLDRRPQPDRQSAVLVPLARNVGRGNEGDGQRRREPDHAAGDLGARRRLQQLANLRLRPGPLVPVPTRQGVSASLPTWRGGLVALVGGLALALASLWLAARGTATAAPTSPRPWAAIRSWVYWLDQPRLAQIAAS